MNNLLANKDKLEGECRSIYLMNQSTSDIITFTVKSTFTNNSTYTKVYKTNPGEEILIGCDSHVDYYYNFTKEKCEIVGAVKIK